MLVAAFLVGLPLFFEVGFVILAPLVWNLSRETKRSLLFYGLPMAAALTTTHSMVAPHPAPAAAAQLFGADLGLSILYGIAVSIPMAIVGGIFYGGWIAQAHEHSGPGRSRKRRPKPRSSQWSAAFVRRWSFCCCSCRCC